MKYRAYWISPVGKVVGVPGCHIHLVCREPEIFGLTHDFINAVYEKYQEPFGFEGHARQIIMRKLIENGWIRLRFIYEPYLWKAQVNRLNIQAIENLITCYETTNIHRYDPKMEIMIIHSSSPYANVYKINELKEIIND